MRETPAHVAERVREYDRDARVVWEESRARWFLWWRDRRVCALEHRDGSPMVADVVVEEVMEILQRSDNHKDGPERLREIERNVKLHGERVQERTRRIAAEAETHASEVMDVEANGPRPFVHMTNNPLCTRSAHHVA